jgi:DNA-binding transcriptional ArsR family regulator
VPTQNAGWSVGPSIATELDAALSFLTDFAESGSRDLPEELMEALQRVPKDWLSEAPEMLGGATRWIFLLTHLASLTGMLREADYAKATLAIRSMTLADALERQQARAAQLSLEPATAAPPVEQLVGLTTRVALKTIDQVGLAPSRREAFVAGVRREVSHAVRLLAGGDLHARFWHWLDRGYYEFYRPWRETRAGVMKEQEERALSALGALSGDTPPPLRWLPQQNAIWMLTELGEAAQAGRIRVHFWVQPFGLFDYWYLEPGCALVSFVEPGKLFEGFRSEAEAVANRAKAIADPTRLIILRIVRHFGMDNTQIADYLGIARPTVSVHAKVLREAGLIDTTQQGRQVKHTIKAAEVRRLFQDLIHFLDLPEDE